MAVIPARYASTRFPGKPLALIAGKSMIQRVYEQASKCARLSEVIVATEDARIYDHVTGFGGRCMMTSDHHRSGTDRIGEVIENLALQNPDSIFDFVVNIQGDEPMLEPKQLEELLSGFEDKQAAICSLQKEIREISVWKNPNVVKVVNDLNGFALYFSRSAIPYNRDQKDANWPGNIKYYQHIGLYAFRMEALKAILKLPAGTLEVVESLEQLRWMENGYRLKMIITDYETIAVDTPEDLSKLTNKI